MVISKVLPIRGQIDEWQKKVGQLLEYHQPALWRSSTKRSYLFTSLHCLPSVFWIIKQLLVEGGWGCNKGFPIIINGMKYTRLNHGHISETHGTLSNSGATQVITGSSNVRHSFPSKIWKKVRKNEKVFMNYILKWKKAIAQKLPV